LAIGFDGMPLLNKRPLIGLAGVIVIAFAGELNDQVSAIALPDILGGLGISHDPGTWITSLYVSGECFGLATSPWWGVTLTLRRWLLFVIALICVSTVLVPFSPNLTILYGLRVLQGIGGGLTIPLLMTTALRVLPPAIRLYGLIAYALTTSFFPNLSAPAAALWTEFVGWRFVFFQAIPLSAIAAVLIWYGMPQDQPQYQRLRNLDWRGMLLVAVGVGSLTTMLQQGDRLDWWNSPVICVLALVSAIAIPLLLINEWFREVPLFKLQLLARRNLSYGAMTLFCFIIIGISSSTLPFTYLEQVQQFRPVQLYVLSLEIALLQLVFLPIVAWLLDFPWVDARVLNFLGYCCLFIACIGDSRLISSWDSTQFVIWQALQSAGDALVVMPLLMMATNSIQPQEGPFGSALFNMPRGIAEAVGPWLLQLVARWRGALHSDRLTDQMGLDRYRVIQAPTIDPQRVPALLPSGVPRSPDALSLLSGSLHAQTDVMVLSDAFLVVAGVVAFLMVAVCIIPVRTYPPRIMLAAK
jgi:MFS transporter, DHA2 family, multidrug resistance protein